MFKENCCFCLTLCPKKGRTFTASRNARMVDLNGLGCFRNEIARDFPKNYPDQEDRSP